MSGFIGLDFETYGATDLPRHGLARYVGCKTFMPLMASAVWPDTRGIYEFQRFDFTFSWQRPARTLKELIGSSTIIAHNAPFERAVLAWMGLDYPVERFIDSAVVARVAGAGGKLEAAAPQLLGIDKMEAGKNYIKQFSIPGPYQEANGNLFFDRGIVADNPVDWAGMQDYCDLDARLGLQIVEQFRGSLCDNELEYQALTMRMNERGWKVDVALVEEMQRRYIENQMAALMEFRQACNAPDLNLNSLKQLKEWCLERGVKANSFAEKNVEKLLAAVSKKLDDNTTLHKLTTEQIDGYSDVEALLRTKLILGGSSLKKLQVILDTVTEDGRLVDQYLHCGAGQSLRTTGRSVQMQNLKQLHEIGNVEDLVNDAIEWDNNKLAENIRQCFTATDVMGRLIVGDFSSIEGRGLAWLACADWKLRAYHQGQDLYKVLASKIMVIPYDQITKEQRQFGKVGELACGYQAGPEAVQDFAAGMGVELSQGEATKLVYDWRDANPEIVALWDRLDEMLHNVVADHQRSTRYLIGETGWSVEICQSATPGSLTDQHPGAQSIKLLVVRPNGDTYLRRYFHGCYIRGRNVGYYKPSTLKHGELWKNHFMNPKTKQLQFYQLYGGKLSGILTQSLCREVFFTTLSRVETWCSLRPTAAQVVGQFHDEIVVDWNPSGASLQVSMESISTLMSQCELPGFPMAADVKAGYRYIK